MKKISFFIFKLVFNKIYSDSYNLGVEQKFILLNLNIKIRK